MWLQLGVCLVGSAAKAGADPIKCVKMQRHVLLWDTCGVPQVPPGMFDILCFIALCLQLRLLRGWSVKRPRVRPCTVLLKTTLQVNHSQAGQDTTRTPPKGIRNLLFGIGSRRTAATSVRRMMASAASHKAFRWNLFWSAACGCMLFCNVVFDLFRCDWVTVLLGSAAKAGATP